VAVVLLIVILILIQRLRDFFIKIIICTLGAISIYVILNFNGNYFRTAMFMYHANKASINKQELKFTDFAGQNWDSCVYIEGFYSIYKDDLLYTSEVLSFINEKENRYYFISKGKLKFYISVDNTVYQTRLGLNSNQQRFSFFKNDKIIIEKIKSSKGYFFFVISFIRPKT